ncbi:pyrophosphatase ppax [Phlyctema vagabunda]|uniref:Pyrophosphatase ppax n=1 Tax=Phlyctema vagabunda TaxID=108571 RepID=A0ABR4PEA5_9HELO
MVSLVIFDFDGTLFDTHESIGHTIKLTFQALLPDSIPSPDEIHRLIASGAGLSDTFRALHPEQGLGPHQSSFEQSEELWITTYRQLYSTHGQALIKPFPGAEELLGYLKKHEIPTAIVSNKGVAAVKVALQRNGLAGCVPEDLIVGDKTVGAERKPHRASFTAVLMPTLKRLGLGNWQTQTDATGVLVVGDTVADIQFAKNIGAKAAWCQYGYGDQDACHKLDPDFVVGSLAEVVDIVSKENTTK